MITPAVEETADTIRDTERIEVEAAPCPEAVLSAAIVARALQNLGKLFRITFRPAPSDDNGHVAIPPNGYRDAYLLGKDLGYESPELAIAASISSPRGIDMELMDEGLNRGTISIEQGLSLTGDIQDSLENSIDPFIEVTAGDSLETGALLGDLGIGLGKSLENLDDSQTSKLASYLVLTLISQGASSESVELLLSGTMEGELGNPAQLSLAAEAGFHYHGAADTLAALLKGDTSPEEINRFCRETASAVSSHTQVSDENFRVCRIEKGPGLKAAKVLWRDYNPDEPLALETGGRIYAIGFDDSDARKLVTASTDAMRGDGWLRLEGLTAEDLEDVA